MLDIRSHDDTYAAPAPGDLEILQRFVNLHVHHDDGATLPAPREMVRDFLVERGLLERRTPFTVQDHRQALRLADGFRALIRAKAGDLLPARAADVLDDVSETAGLHPHFRFGEPVLVPAHGGVAGAFGRLVAIAFLARFDGSWTHLKECANDGCRAVFFDRSKNHSGRWCSMSGCGNRAKVRAWRERQKAHDNA